LRCAARCRFGTGVDQVGDGFRLRQINLVVQKCALGKLTGGSQTQTRKQRLVVGSIRLLCNLQASCEQKLQHHRATMRLQLQHIFPGEGMRRGEIDRKAPVYGAAIGITKGKVDGLAGRQ